jgi:serine/threonine protein kinase
LKAAEIEEIKNEVKILKELKSDYILRYYEEYDDESLYLIFTEICVIINHKAEDKRNY